MLGEQMSKVPSNSLRWQTCLVRVYDKFFFLSTASLPCRLEIGCVVVCSIYIRCLRLACQPTSQQYCSLILINQHQSPATGQLTVLFSHNKSAPAISHSQANTEIGSLSCDKIPDGYLLLFLIIFPWLLTSTLVTCW